MTSIYWNTDAIAVRGLDLVVGDGAKQLLRDASFQIRRDDRVAILGRNGCGKTSLFQWILSTKEGRGNSWHIYEVAQELVATEETVVNTVLSAHRERGALWARQAVLESLEELTEEETAEYVAIGEQLEAMRADADPPRARKILHGLGFRADEMEKPLSSFSGGWRARVALAMGLFMEPDLLLLDEPTNHLDLEGVLWLSEFLKVWPHAFLVISHNVGFIREVAATQWLLECGRLTVYRCSYNRFLQQRALDARRVAAEWELLEKQVATLCGKGTSDGKRAAEELLAKRQQEGVVRPPRSYHPTFHFVGGGSGGGSAASLLRVRGAHLGYEEKTVLTDVTFALYSGTRVALVGANGSGKSTLVRFLKGELPALNALEASFESQAGIRVVSFDQHFYHTLPAEKTSVEYITGVAAEGVSVHTIRRILGSSGLEPEAHTRAIGTLSGGQKARVYFAAIAAQCPDILLMDEPTNHLDIETIEGLASGLQMFPGAVLLVSHDLDFLEKVATEVWQTAGGALVPLRGDAEEGLSAYVDIVVSSLEL